MKGAIAAALAVGVLGTGIIGVPQVRRDFKRVWFDHGIESFAKEDPQHPGFTPQERAEMFLEIHVDVRWVVPVLPGVILVSYDTSGSCMGPLPALIWWYPGRTGVLFARG